MKNTANHDLLCRTVEGALGRYAAMQINLQSPAARLDLARAMASEVCAKFYLVPFASSESPK